MNKKVQIKENVNKQVNNIKTPMNKGNTRISRTFRLLQNDAKKLNRIANVKKATQTKVLTELIRIAHAGLFMPEMKALDKILEEFYLKAIQTDMKNKDLKPKRKVYK